MIQVMRETAALFRTVKCTTNMSEIRFDAPRTPFFTDVGIFCYHVFAASSEIVTFPLVLLAT